LTLKIGKSQSGTTTKTLWEHNPPRVVKVQSDELMGMSLDERSVAGLIKRALKFEPGEEWVETNPGVHGEKGSQGIVGRTF